MDRIQPVNISAFIIPTCYLHTDCRPVGDGAGAVCYSWNILGGEGRSQYPSAEWLNIVKKERATPGDLWGGKPIVWGAAQFRLCFPGAWAVMTWLCPHWIVGLYSVWISWWLHCEGPRSLRSVYPAAGAPPELPCSGAGHSTMHCGKEKKQWHQEE